MGFSRNSLYLHFNDFIPLLVQHHMIRNNQRTNRLERLPIVYGLLSLLLKGLLRPLSPFVLQGNHLGPRDQAHRWKATIAVFLARLGQVGQVRQVRQVRVAWCGHLLPTLMGPTNPRRRCCSSLEWAPALYLVEFWNVWMKVYPNQSLL